jgi:hypothetical protein
MAHPRVFDVCIDALKKTVDPLLVAVGSVGGAVKGITVVSRGEVCSSDWRRAGVGEEHDYLNLRISPCIYIWCQVKYG